MTNKKTDTELLDELSHQVAEEQAEKAAGKPENAVETAAIDRLEANARDMLRNLRKEAFDELRTTRPEPRVHALPARILSMTRDAVLAALRALEAQAPVELQTAYRRLDSLELDELRPMLADLEETLGLSTDE
jgi:hypothetical protein